VAYLAFEVFKKEILKAVIREFLARGLDKTYAKEIAEWMQYIDQKRFAVLLDKQMMKEVERFQGEIQSWSPTELKEFVINDLTVKK